MGRTRYHFVILDYLCEAVSGEARAASDVTDVAWAREEELEKYRVDADCHAGDSSGHLRWGERSVKLPTERSSPDFTPLGLAGGGFGQPAEAAFAPAKIVDGVGKIVGFEIRATCAA